MATPPESPLSTPWSSRPPSRLDSQGGTSRPETPYSEYTNASRPRTPAPLVRRLVAVAARRENAEVWTLSQAWFPYSAPWLTLACCAPCAARSCPVCVYRAVRGWSRLLTRLARCVLLRVDGASGAKREYLHTDKQCESQFTRSRTLRLPVLGAHTQDHDAAVKWSASRAAGVLGSGVGGQVGAASLQDVCTCSHAEAGLRAAMRACAGRVDSKEGELVQALTLQVRHGLRKCTCSAAWTPRLTHVPAPPDGCPGRGGVVPRNAAADI